MSEVKGVDPAAAAEEPAEVVGVTEAEPPKVLSLPSSRCLCLCHLHCYIHSVCMRAAARDGVKI